VFNPKKGERYATQKIPAGGVGFEFFVNRPRDLELLDPQSKKGTLNMNPTLQHFKYLGVDFSLFFYKLSVHWVVTAERFAQVVAPEGM
jgi:hypothetical protein